MFSGWWIGASGAACADDASINANAAAIILDIFSSLVTHYHLSHAHYSPSGRSHRVGLKANF
jgi:hypothetical protein